MTVGEKQWSDVSMLRAIPNPTDKSYQIQHKNPELTFLGVENQPDLSTVRITFYPNEFVIELKSLKLYFQQFRNKILSYERLVNIVFEDLMHKYKPRRLRVTMTTRPRGGISSNISVDSVWRARGKMIEFKG